MSYTIVVPTVYGQMLVNRHDVNQTQALILTGKAIDHNDIEQVCQFITPGSTAIDAGACFGAWTLAFAKKAGLVFSFEVQRQIYQQLCGSLALNGIENVRAENLVLGDNSNGYIGVPTYDYNKALQFGCVYLGKKTKHGEMAQEPNRRPELALRRTLDAVLAPHILAVSVIKIDVEGMEVEVLRGARRTITRSRPVLFVETLLTGQEAIEEELAGLDYSFVNTGMDVLCLPNEKWEVSPRSTGEFSVTRRKA